MKTMLLMLMALFTACGVLTAQDAQSGDSASAPAAKSGQKSGQKAGQTPELQDATTASPAAAPSDGPPLLKDAGPARVEEASRKAAHNLAKTSPSGPQAKDDGQAKRAQTSKKQESASPPSEVGEFHTLPAGTHQGSAAPVAQKDQSPLKRIHGDVYGAGRGSGHASSESAGGTSKGGKTSVYVQSDQATSSTAPPQ